MELCSIEKLIEEFKASLSDKEKKAYSIAESHMGTLFQIEKTAGYLQWLEKKKLIN